MIHSNSWNLTQEPDALDVCFKRITPPFLSFFSVGNLLFIKNTAPIKRASVWILAHNSYYCDQ